MSGKPFIDATIEQLKRLADRNAVEAHKENEAERLEQERIHYELLKSQLLDIAPFSKQQISLAATKKRIKKAAKDFWYFDKVYFPKEFYGDDYAPPGKFHRDIVDIAQSTDKKAHIILGPRDHAKTAILQKYDLWVFIFGHRRFMAIGSETLETPDNYLADLIYYLTYNERLVHDFKLKWHECSTKKLFATSEQNPKGTFVQTLSEEKSARGKQRLQRRYDYIHLTDFENYTSSLTKEARRKRRNRLNEMRGSLTPKGVLVWDANNFDVDTLTNELKEEQEQGIGSDAVVVHVFKAWDETRPYSQRSLWHSRFPAKSEDELKQMLMPEDEYDWDGNFQQNPKRRSGELFPREYYHEGETPEDLQSVIFVDPNCSEKGKGDTTGMPCLGFSVETSKYHVAAARCKSYFHSNDLLRDALQMLYDQQILGNDVIAIGMDGNVSQESIWKNNINNFVQIEGRPYPPVQFRKYNVDLLVTNLSTIWKEKKIIFPIGFAETEEGKEAIKQLTAFNLKKANKKDDFPDALICAFTLLIELGIAMVLKQESRSVSVNKYRVNMRCL